MPSRHVIPKYCQRTGKAHAKVGQNVMIRLVPGSSWSQQKVQICGIAHATGGSELQRMLLVITSSGGTHALHSALAPPEALEGALSQAMHLHM